VRRASAAHACRAAARSRPRAPHRPGDDDLAATADPAAGLVGRARAHLEMFVAEVGQSAGVSIAAGARSVLSLDQVDGDQDVTLRADGLAWTVEESSPGITSVAARI
jgi:DNA-binding IclR family transcriptional regulator